MALKIRRDLWPRTLRDFAASSFLFLMIPIIYWFEVFIVMPYYFGGDSGPVYLGHAVFSTFLLFNVVGNFLAAVLVDSSIRGEMMPSNLLPTWRFCDICETVSPPRSWHCTICGSCILKRDHHCNFTACCIGHRNQRYFIMFLFYFMTATAYASYFNAYYLWTTFSFRGLFNMSKILFPFAILVTGLDNTVDQYYRLLCVLVIVGLCSSGVLFVYHIDNLFKGKVMFEKIKNQNPYDSGSAKSNMIMVLGKRWYLSLISPFAASELPHDGIHWDAPKLN